MVVPFTSISKNGLDANSAFLFFQLELVVCDLHHPCLYHLPGTRGSASVIRGQQVQDQEAELDGAVHHDVRGAQGWSRIRSCASDQ